MVGSGINKGQVIGVTGLIGSGKSVVSSFLARRLACHHLDADSLVRDLMVPGHQGWLAIKDYNPKYIRGDGQLDRVLLRDDIFSQPRVKYAVDSLVHPIVRARLVEILGAGPGARTVVEVPLLFEAGWAELFDRVILVHAEKNVCLQRVVERDGVGIEQAEKSYQSQMAAVEKIKRADHVIDNSGSWWNSQLQIMHLANILRLF